MRIAAWIVAVAGSLALALVAVCGAVAWKAGDGPFPVLVGSWPRQPEERPAYRVAVLGDSQKGTRNLANLLEAVKKEKVDFILHTGDLVSHNDEGHYRLARRVLERAGVNVPFLVVPGNHDVKGDPERFRRKIGQLEYSFTWGKAAFVVVNNSTGEPPSVADLDRKVGHYAADGRAVIVAMHVPPFDVQGRVLPGWEPFLEWLQKAERVRYVLCGHVHDYLRRPVGKAVVIANGVGGDYDSWDLAQKVYGTILEVRGDEISDRVFDLPPERTFQEDLEHLAIGHVAEVYRRHPGFAWGGTALLAAVAAAGYVLGIRRGGKA